MRTPATATRPKPAPAKVSSFSAPVRGWIANESLAIPTEGGAAILENWFATATGVRMRAGCETYATLGAGGEPVTSLFSYLNGAQEAFFGATETSVYDITSVVSAEPYQLATDEGDLIITDEGDEIGFSASNPISNMAGFTGGDWVVVQFATAGGVFLLGVNGENDAFLFDGTYFYPLSDKDTDSIDYDNQVADFTEGETLTGGTSGATATILRVIDSGGGTGTLWLQDVTGGPFQDGETLTDGSGGQALADGVDTTLIGAITGLPTSSLSYVWVYKQRLWFVEKNSLNAWYLPVDQVSGALVKFPLGGVFGRGGSLLFGQTWSLDSGAEGGLSEQNVFVSTEGEVAAYQGIDPGATDGSWSKVGVYRIGRPLGAKGFIRAGGDLVISTDIGFVPLSVAIQKDVAALSPAAVSYPIEVAWNDRVANRGALPWQAEVWPTQQMCVIAMPPEAGATAEMLISNARTGAWSLYTGWDGTCLEVFKGRLFFGSPNGAVKEAEISGADDGLPYTATCLPLFSDTGSPASLKTVGAARAVMLSPYPVSERLSISADFTINLPPAPNAVDVGEASVWGAGIWGTSLWGEPLKKSARQNWRSVSGMGYSLAPALQITSGSAIPPAVDLVRIEITTQTAGIVS
jgi:hypothetical protein